MPTLRDVLDLPKCPHCGVAQPLLHRQWGGNSKGEVSGVVREWGVYICRSCGGLVAGGGPANSGGRVETVIPTSIAIAESIPTRPRAYLQQALDTLHAPAASIMVSASAVDSMLKEHGLTTGSLNNRINKAAEEHLITAEMAAWAHDIRLDANDERHADVDASAATADDARRCLDFALALAEYLFVLPARVARGRTA